MAEMVRTRVHIFGSHQTANSIVGDVGAPCCPFAVFPAFNIKPRGNEDLENVLEKPPCVFSTRVLIGLPQWQTKMQSLQGESLRCLGSLRLLANDNNKIETGLQRLAEDSQAV